MRTKRQTTYEDFPLTLDGHGGLPEQLARALKRMILGGLLAAGAPLPPTRELARIQGVSRETVVVAYELLSAEQLVVARQGSGTHVLEGLSAAAPARSRATVRPPSRFAARARSFGPSSIAAQPHDLRYNLHYGTPAQQGDFYRSWRRKLSAAALQVGCGYPEVAGHAALREALCDYLARRRGVVASPGQVFIVGGTQQALTLLARTLLEEGDTVVLEDPSYELALRSLTVHGAQILTIPVDQQGLQVDQLPGRGPKLALVTPSHQFPSGVTMSLERRLALLAWARRAGAWIIEDDYDSEFRYHGSPIPALRSLDLHDRVIYVGSFSKTMFPSMRLGYVVCPEPLCEDFTFAKKYDDLGCPTIEQAALATFVRSRQFERHLGRQMRTLAERRGVLIEELRRLLPREILIEDTNAGMHLVVWFTRLSYADIDTLVIAAREKGLGIYPIHPSYTRRPPRPGLLMGFASLGPQQLRHSVLLLATCLRDLRSAGDQHLPARRESRAAGSPRSGRRRVN